MASTPTPAPTQKRTVQKTVFDLGKFDDVLLKKEVELPPAVGSLEEAQAAVGNNIEELLKVINAGLEDRFLNTVREDMSGFKEVNEDGELAETEYAGKFATEEMGGKINAAVLTIAKLNGYEKSLPKEKKAEIKEKARKFFRDNPAMLGSLGAA